MPRRCWSVGVPEHTSILKKAYTKEMRLLPCMTKNTLKVFLGSCTHQTYPLRNLYNVTVGLYVTNERKIMINNGVYIVTVLHSSKHEQILLCRPRCNDGGPLYVLVEPHAIERGMFTMQLYRAPGGSLCEHYRHRRDWRYCFLRRTTRATSKRHNLCTELRPQTPIHDLVFTLQ